MSLAASTVWWTIAGLLVAAELATGTFYLLMLSFGCIVGAVAAHAGVGATGQIAWAAIVGIGATLVWHLKRLRGPRALPAASNADVNIDIGETVQVDAWNADGTARVLYRGATWSASHTGPGLPIPGRHRIVALHGSQLQLSPATPV